MLVPTEPLTGQGQAVTDVELEVQMIDELDVELCVLCHRERERGEVVLREFELFWGLDETAGARKSEGCAADPLPEGEAKDNQSGENQGGTGEGVKQQGRVGHRGLWLVCRDEQDCVRCASV